MPHEFSGFYFITDSRLTRQGAAKDAEDAIRGGAGIIQYREKDKPSEDMTAEAAELAALCRDAGVMFIVNDDPELAIASGADGLHIGPHDMPLEDARKRFSGIIGVSCGTAGEAMLAEDGGANYIAASPVFFTSTKDDIGKVVGLDGVREFRAATKLPVVAIGGIKLGNVRDVVLAGADMVCAISATVGTDDVEASVRSFVEAVSSAKREMR